jgi:hypothetical protein
MADYLSGYLSKERVRDLKKHFTVCEVCRDVAKIGLKISKEVEARLKKKKS